MQHTNAKAVVKELSRSVGSRRKPGRPRVVAVAAARNTVALIKDIGHDYNGRRRGWKAHVARTIGVSSTTVGWLLNGRIRRLGSDAVQKISDKTGCPVEILQDTSSA